MRLVEVAILECSLARREFVTERGIESFIRAARWDPSMPDVDIRAAARAQVRSSGLE
jgi:hypothetical protein